MLILHKLFGARKSEIFEDIIGHEHIKKLFRMTLDSNSNTHILLTGAPATAKTMFLLSLRQHLKTTFIDGGNTTKVGMVDYLFENKPRYLSRQNQTFLLNLMENGIVCETKHRFF
jgi:hypothetical protein